MNLQQRAEAFIKLGKEISFFLEGKNKNPLLNSSLIESCRQNGWFTEDNVRFSLGAISEELSEKKIHQWLKKYPSPNFHPPHTVRVIIPSNIPLAGFHDFFCVLMSGNIFLGKCSARDNILLPAIANVLISLVPEFKKYIFFSDDFSKRLQFDALIATGSNNSSRYFEYYFGKYPHIIRKNRNSVGILAGKESNEELLLLGNDIFRYFGMGCRNVSKIFVPENYDFNLFFKGIFGWNEIINHNKYANNYTYNKAILLMNKIKILDNGFVLLKQDDGISSPVSVIYYDYYYNLINLKKEITLKKK